MFKVEKFKNGVSFDIWVQPKSARNELVEIKENSLKIKICAPPKENKANKECLKYLAKLFGVAKSQLTIVSGAKSRKKKIHISGLFSSQVYQVVESHPKKSNS